MATDAPDPDRPLVLDASVLLSGKPVSGTAQVYAPYTVLEEVTGRGRDRRAIDYALEARLQASHPSPEALARVESVAKRTGDHARLSQPDKDLLALAIDVDGTLVTDDYSIQNVAQTMGIPFASFSQRGIGEVWTWIRRCTGCRREVTGDRPECPVCGSAVKTVRKR